MTDIAKTLGAGAPCGTKKRSKASCVVPSPFGVIGTCMMNTMSGMKAK